MPENKTKGSKALKLLLINHHEALSTWIADPIQSLMTPIEFIIQNMMGSKYDETSRELLQLGDLIQDAISQFIALRQSASENVSREEGSLPSKPLFDAQRTLLAAAGMITELVSEPQSRLLEVSSQYFEARALHIAASHRIPDILAHQGEVGMDIKALSSKVGIESRKLCGYSILTC